MTHNGNNGLVTKIWGPPGWKFMHSVAYGYPLNPTDKHKKYYKHWFQTIGKILPCGACRTSYSNFISTGDTKLTNEVMKNRGTLTKWFFKVHQAVNNKLKMDYGSTYKNVTAQYEAYRAKDKSLSKRQKGGSRTKRKLYRLVR